MNVPFDPNEKRIRIYVAGPYSGDNVQNIRRAILIADQVFHAGFYPFCPHTMTSLWDMVWPHDYEEWLRLDEAWIQVCDALFLMQGESKGAAREVEVAQSLEIPVFTSMSDLIRWGLSYDPPPR